MKGMAKILYILAFAFSGDITNVKFEAPDSSPINYDKVKHNSYQGKTYYQNPNVKQQRFYHNKTIPRGDKGSRMYSKIPNNKGIDRKVRKSLVGKL